MDLGEIVDWAKKSGWDVRTDAKGYTRFYNPKGAYVANYPATPSNAYRRMKDLTTALKREGLQIPPPSKKEQRSKRRKEGRSDED